MHFSNAVGLLFSSVQFENL